MAEKKTVHRHGCRRCRIPYEDTCKTPKQNELCTGCRGGIPWLLLIDNARPRQCCVDTSRLVTKDELKRYTLAGEASWWICATCKRTQIFKPKPGDVFIQTKEKS